MDDLDDFIHKCHTVVMEALESLPTDVRDWIEFLRKSLKEKSSRLSPTDLAKYTGVAFELTFTGSRREEKLANAMARGVSVREKMATEEGGSMSAEEAARFLGMAKQSALNLYHQGKLLGWRSEKQGAVRFQNLGDDGVGLPNRFPDEFVRKAAGRAFGMIELSGGIDRTIDGQTVLRADDVVLLAMPGRRMDRAGALLKRDMVGDHSKGGPIDERMVEDGLVEFASAEARDHRRFSPVALPRRRFQ